MTPKHVGQNCDLKEKYAECQCDFTQLNKPQEKIPLQS